MGQPPIPQDDLLDIIELTQKLEDCMSEVLRDNETRLAVSALISASINCMLAQCKTQKDVAFHRNLFMQVLDTSIRCIQIKDPDSSSSS